jgi:hypothetical protein
MSRMVWKSGILLATLGALTQPRSSAQEPEIPVHKLTVSPAAAPDPALRYRLLPELRDTTPGNAVLLYYRAFAPDWWRHVQKDKELTDKLDEALDKPPADVKAIPQLAFVRDWNALKEVDRAARRAYCDWELTPRVREDGVMLLLPDIQSMRQFTSYLKIRAKLELADLQFDKAAYTLQTGFQMGRHVAHAPTLIQALMGAAAAAVMLSEVEEWAQTPGSPNLYWALTELPQPFIPLRIPYQGEKLFIDNLFPGYREALADPSKVPPPLGPELQRKLVQAIDRPADGTLHLLILATKKYAVAKAYLREHGRTAEQVEALPVLSAVMLYEVAIVDRLYDEVLKAQGLPYPVARPLLQHADTLIKEEVVRSGSPGLSIAGMLMPAILKVHRSSVQRDRTINLLRTVELLRLYAAAHGKWPERLADVTEAPVPPDPLTGQPFDYRLDGETAILTAPPPTGEPPHEGNCRRYEITLRK